MNEQGRALRMFPWIIRRLMGSPASAEEASIAPSQQMAVLLLKGSMIRVSAHRGGEEHRF